MNLKASLFNVFFLISLFILIAKKSQFISAKSIIIANYHNVLLFFPKEYGGNDDLRVIFDVRNATIGTFKYMPVIVDVAYDSVLNNAYCYLESAITSYILLLKWAGGSWCYQVLFEFPASQFSKYMYHSIIVMDDFLYWTTDRYIMSGRTPGYEKRLLLQPAWNRLYSMTADYNKQIIYVSAFDYTENAIFRCSLRVFSCTKLLSTDFTINQIHFNMFNNQLYAASIQGVQSKFLYRYAEDFNKLIPVNTIQEETSDLIFLGQDFAVLTNQQTISITTNINLFNSTRKTNPKLIDPYALQYTFTFNQILNFDTYPYPYFFTDYHDLLYKNSLYLFYFYICGMDYVENDNAFLPQMDLNNQFLRIDNCQNRFIQERDAYLIPSIIAGCATLFLITIGVLLCFWRSKICEKRVNRIKLNLKMCCCKKENNKQNKIKVYDSYNSIDKNVIKNDSSAISSYSSSEKSKIENDNLDYFTNNFKLNETEMYDNDPSNLIEYNRYMQKPNIKKYISSGSTITLGKKNKPLSPVLSTPTLSQNSSSSSNRVFSPTSSSISAISNNRVKFNDLKIHHIYDKDEYPKYSTSYSKSKEIPIKLAPDFFDNEYNDKMIKNDNSFLSSSSLNSSISSPPIPTGKESKHKFDRRKAKHYNKDYISSYDIRLYGPNNQRNNFINILKAGDDPKKEIKNTSNRSFVSETKINI